MKVAYLVNRYPSVSHSFVRREILALEAQGLSILRYSLRPAGTDLVDGRDIEEAGKTRAVLGQPAWGLLADMIAAAFVAPRFDRPESISLAEKSLARPLFVRSALSGAGELRAEIERLITALGLGKACALPDGFRRRPSESKSEGAGLSCWRALPRGFLS